MAIDPVSIPDGASIDYGENDVRHFSEGDAMDVPSLSNPTRHLAQRDVELAQKINEVVEIVNNKEQFVPLPVLRTVLSPNSEEVVTNYRIPYGFEARVLNASITSNPPSASAELNIFYGTGFGGATGEVLVTTASEATGGTVFKSQGELIVTLKNKGGSTLELIASIILTMRPVGMKGGVLISAPPPATEGRPGPQGIQGVAGVGTPGTAGAPGMSWSGAWSALVSYAPSKVVSFSSDGGAHTSSYIALASTSPGESPASAPAKWQIVASAGSDGADGTGTPGANGFNFRGAWSASPSPAYAAQDVVTYVSGTTASAYYAGLGGIMPTAGVPPPSTGWTLLFQIPATVYSSVSVPASVITGGGYVAGSASAPYLAFSVGTTSVNMQETRLVGSGSPRGVVFLKYSVQANFSGPLSIQLPKIAGGALVDWQASACVAVAESDTAGSVALLTTPAADKFTITAPADQSVSITIMGQATV